MQGTAAGVARGARREGRMLVQAGDTPFPPPQAWTGGGGGAGMGQGVSLWTRSQAGERAGACMAKRYKTASREPLSLVGNV